VVAGEKPVNRYAVADTPGQWNGYENKRLAKNAIRKVMKTKGS
jgi:hypothetical protein